MIKLILYILGMVVVIYLQKYPITLLEDSMVALSRKLRLSSIVAGATFIAIVSSSPEFGTAFAGVVFEKTFEIGFDAIIWSAIFNILVITGASGAVSPTPIKIDRLVLKRDLLCYFIVLVLFLFFTFDKKIVWWENLLLIVLYLIYIICLNKKNGMEPIKGKDYSKIEIIKKSIIGLIGILILSASLVELGVVALKHLGILLNMIIPFSVIACTFWGPGTSIVDLMMSLNLSRNGLGDTGIVNGIASNTFDIAICLGFNGLIYNISIGQIDVKLSSQYFLFSLLAISLFIVTVLLNIKRELHKKESWLLIAIFCIMLIVQIVLGFKYGY